jgi:hypothetical protein
LVLVFLLVLVSFIGGSKRALGQLWEAPGILKAEGLLERLGGSMRFYETMDTHNLKFES